ncbi:MAG TPA: c-type cytochrome [Usitatibacteraceae bacterium]|nr:c-type cytochrome [Usitatibacteraceae bacterium]
MATVYATLAQGAVPASAAKPDLERGKQIAATVCAACHGPDGNSLVPANPIIAGQHADYLAAQLAAFKSGARANPIMAGMSAALTPEDMRNVSAWFSQQVVKPSAAKDQALAIRGQQIWRGGIKQGNVPACAGCHGAAGAGIPAQYPRLAGQFADLTFTWLKAFASGARANPVMAGIAAKLSEADMKAVSEYVAGLR